MVDGVVVGASKTAGTGQPLPKGKVARIEFSVSEDRIEASVNDKVAYSYQGSFGRLSLSSWAVPEKRKLFLGFKGKSRISRIELAPMDATKFGRGRVDKAI